MRILAIIAIICLQNDLLLLTIIVPSPKTFIIAINLTLLLQLIFLTTHYMHYWG